MLNWLFKKTEAAPVAQEPAEVSTSGMFSTHADDGKKSKKSKIPDLLAAISNNLRSIAPVVKSADGSAVAMDGFSGINDNAYSIGSNTNLNDALLGWYLNQGFIGWQMCSILAQNWLIDRCCTMPARDAVRQGYTIESDGGELTVEMLKEIKKLDKEFRTVKNLEQFVRMGRTFGVRIAFFKVESRDKDYYEKPFNIDGIEPDSYRGIVQVDPYWTSPILDAEAASQPDAIDFYEPTWWLINGKKYHRTHLIIFRNSDLTDILKPAYIYGGVPVPQRIMERIYASERTANEAPLLAMTKRMTVFKTDIAAAYANKDVFDQRMAEWVAFRDNNQIKLADVSDDVSQIDTSLTDLDAVIMTQYQLVAAAAGVPATKLLGTTPKGFNSSGSYEENSYREELESLQTNDLTPFLERHYAIMMRSKFPNSGVEISPVWKPLDSPTAAEMADINLKKAQTGQILQEGGSIDAYDERERLINDPESNYSNLEPVEREIREIENENGAQETNPETE